MAKKMTVQHFKVQIDGPHCGLCSVDGEMITVSNSTGSKTTQIGGLPVDLLAKMLLRELVHEAGRL